MIPSYHDILRGMILNLEPTDNAVIIYEKDQLETYSLILTYFVLNQDQVRRVQVDMHPNWLTVAVTRTDRDVSSLIVLHERQVSSLIGRRISGTMMYPLSLEANDPLLVNGTIKPCVLDRGKIIGVP